VAQAISNEIKVKLTPVDRARNGRSLPANQQAYEAYLRGRYCWNKSTQEGIEKAIDYFQKAVVHDPDYALAYAGLADGYRALAVAGALPSNFAGGKALAAAQKALKINDHLCEAHKVMGAARFRFNWEWKQSEAELQRALELNPSHADAHRVYASYLQAMGRVEEAIAEVEAARQLDPLSLLIEAALGRALYLARRYDAAIPQCRKALELDPDYAPAHFNLGRVLVETGNVKEGIAEFERGSKRGEVLYQAALGNAYARSGENERARSVLKKLEKLAGSSYVCAYEVAKVHVGLGQKERAMAWLERAYAQQSVRLVRVKVDPVFDPLRSNPEFQELLRRMHFPALDN
jgi:tetratricopeptide (TPR) repeat protein